jgi:putative sterol carrier protein
MAIPFGTTEWASALRDTINRSSEYRNTAAKWGSDFNGNLVFAFEADDTLTAPLYLLLRLEEGRCDGAEFISTSTHPDAGFVLRAPFSLWRAILERKALAATAILTGKMKVEGPKMVLLKHTAANRALVFCTASVDTVFPGE